MLALVLTSVGCAPRLPASPLSYLIGPERPDRLVRIATTDRAGKNADFISIAPGETATVMDARGPGVVRHVWMTVKPRADVDVLRGLVLRAYWDDEAEPSVEAPIGDFFAVGFGERAEVTSMVVEQTSGGMGCYWPMPFRRRAVWTLTNHGTARVESVYLHVDVSRPDALPADTPYFHAQFRRARTATENPYVVLDTRGAGIYVGCVLSMQNLAWRSVGFLEGNDVFTVDDEPVP